uniref:Nuclear RNA polymerase D1B n=1 Tax=Tanacetum cinerariifolium TaxID=118510 RepID=A0A699HMK7_TANCI|nr:nuclear RNA polymerase D1B [Tanacetum cinerariifolium]
MALCLYCTFNGSKWHVECNFLSTKLPKNSVVGQLLLTKTLAEPRRTPSLAGIYPVTQSCESYGSDTSLAKSLTEESKFNSVKRSESVAIGAGFIMPKKDDNKPQVEAEGSSEQTTDKEINWDGTRRNEAGTKSGERRKRDGFLKEITMRGQLGGQMMVLD